MARMRIQTCQKMKWFLMTSLTVSFDQVSLFSWWLANSVWSWILTIRGLPSCKNEKDDQPGGINEQGRWAGDNYQAGGLNADCILTRSARAQASSNVPAHPLVRFDRSEQLARTAVRPPLYVRSSGVANISPRPPATRMHEFPLGRCPLLLPQPHARTKPSGRALTFGGATALQVSKRVIYGFLCCKLVCM